MSDISIVRVFKLAVVEAALRRRSRVDRMLFDLAISSLVGKIFDLRAAGKRMPAYPFDNCGSVYVRAGVQVCCCELHILIFEVAFGGPDFDPDECAVAQRIYDGKMIKIGMGILHVDDGKWRFDQKDGDPLFPDVLAMLERLKMAGAIYEVFRAEIKSRRVDLNLTNPSLRVDHEAKLRDLPSSSRDIDAKNHQPVEFDTNMIEIELHRYGAMRRGFVIGDGLLNPYEGHSPGYRMSTAVRLSCAFRVSVRDGKNSASDWL